MAFLYKNRRSGPDYVGNKGRIQMRPIKLPNIYKLYKLEYKLSKKKRRIFLRILPLHTHNIIRHLHHELNT